jgi:hypothetical protein
LGFGRDDGEFARERDSRRSSRRKELAIYVFPTTTCLAMAWHGG